MQFANTTSALNIPRLNLRLIFDWAMLIWLNESWWAGERYNRR